MKTLVVIGGSRGIGAATALMGAKAGYRIVVGYRRSRAASERVSTNISNNGGDVIALQIDVADVASVNSFFGRVVDTVGIPHGVVYCAGISGPRDFLVNMHPDDIYGVLNINLAGAFICVQAASKLMSRSSGGTGGSIVVLSSEAGRFGGNKISPYAASKAGLNAMVVGVARELASEGIRLNAVSPGVIETDIMKSVSAEERELIAKSIPAGRLGKPEDVANAVIWLLSDAAEYVSGSILSVAGGR